MYPGNQSGNAEPVVAITGAAGNLISKDDFLAATSTAAVAAGVSGIYHLGDDGRRAAAGAKIPKPRNRQGDPLTSAITSVAS